MKERESVKQLKDCKIIPSEKIVTQHRLMVIEMWCSWKRMCKKRTQGGS